MAAEFYIPEKAEKCWAGDPYMLEKAESYASQARKFCDSFSGLKLTIHPWIDNDVPRCVPRLCLFELEGSSLKSKNQPQHFQSARDLRSYFMKSRVDQSSSETQKRLIILEDIDPRSAELLGIVLDIPPAFFISHYHRNINLSTVNRTYAQTKKSKCWKIAIPRYSTVNPLEVNHKGFCDLFSGNSIRGRYWGRLPNNIIFYDNMISYWGQQLGESSWTAVLLIDPRQTYLLPRKVHSKDPSQDAVCLFENCQNKNPWHQQVLVDPPNFCSIDTNHESMFDFLTAAHKEFSYEYSDNPFSATVYARNFVRAAWEAKVARISSASFEMVYTSRENDGSIEAIQLQDQGIVEGYQQLIIERTNIRYARKRVMQIVCAFQCGRDSPSHFYSGRFQIGKNSNAEDLEAESNVWGLLDKELEIIEIQINQHMEEYAQRAALNEAHANRLQSFEANKQTMAANRQARSAGQLTKIATVVVPSTVVASIFSMGGEFAAGEKLFLVYWAISLPVTFALLVWVLQEEISKAWLKLTCHGRPKKHKSDDSESGLGDHESTRNLRRLLRSRSRDATVNKEKATWLHSIEERPSQTARSDSIVPPESGFSVKFEESYLK